jgi:hypothetical protein
VFAGPVRDIVFDGRLLGEGKPDASPMTDVDFAGAVFDGCDFRGVSFDSVRLPDDPHLVLIRDRDVLTRAGATLSDDGGGTAVVVARVVLRHLDDELARGGAALPNLRGVGDAVELLGPLLRGVHRSG